MMAAVTPRTAAWLLRRYELARGGLANENTPSEAMFVMVVQFGGVYQLTTGVAGPLWVGLQNPTARWSAGADTPFASVMDALLTVLDAGAEVFYSDEAPERLRWLADRIEGMQSDVVVMI